MAPLSDAELVALADSPTTGAIVLVRSSAGDDAADLGATRLIRWVEHEADGGEPDDVRWAGARLTIVSTRTYGSAWRDMSEPDRAVFAVLPLRSMRIIVDRDGVMARVQGHAKQFLWEHIAGAARAWTLREMCLTSEFLPKLRSAVAQRDEALALGASIGMAMRCAVIVLVHRGVLVPSEDEYQRLAWEVGGSEFEQFHKSALGADVLSDLPPPFGAAQTAQSLYLVVQEMLQRDGVLKTGSEANQLIQRAWYAPSEPPDGAW